MTTPRRCSLGSRLARGGVTIEVLERFTVHGFSSLEAAMLPSRDSLGYFFHSCQEVSDLVRRRLRFLVVRAQIT